MYLTRSEYDRGVNTFSPEGRLVLFFSAHFLVFYGDICDRLFQVEYAIEAVKLGSTAVGIQTREGVVLAIEKRLTSTLLEPSSVEKIMEIDTHVGAAVSGLIGGMFIALLLMPFNQFYIFQDARTLIDHARVEAQNHRFTFDEVIYVLLCNCGIIMKIFSFFL